MIAYNCREAIYCEFSLSYDPISASWKKVRKLFMMYYLSMLSLV